jgi:hypothetical protein
VRLVVISNEGMPQMIRPDASMVKPLHASSSLRDGPDDFARRLRTESAPSRRDELGVTGG